MQYIIMFNNYFLVLGQVYSDIFLISQNAYGLIKHPIIFKTKVNNIPRNIPFNNCWACVHIKNI